MICPDCYGSGQAHGRDLIYSCETCNGEGDYDPTDDVFLSFASFAALASPDTEERG